MKPGYLILLCLLFAAPTWGLDGPRCGKCKNTGMLACGEHKKKDCELEPSVLWCSHVAGCESCGGTGYVDCVKCEHPEAQRALASKRGMQGKYREEVARVEKEMERSLRAAVSPNFVLVMEIDKAKVGRSTLSGHRLTHLYLDRLERLFADYLEVLGAKQQDFAKRILICVWQDPLDHKDASGRLCGMSAERGVKYLGADPVYSVHASRKEFRDDDALARNVIHNAAHLILSHQSPAEWVGQLKGGWADAGLAHWFEYRYYELCDNYCYQEVYTNRDMQADNWRQRTRALVDKGKAPSLASLVQQNTETLSVEMHLIAFSLVDYLIAEDGAKAGEVFRQMRRKTPTRDAIQLVYGWRMLELQEGWAQWVLDTYPAR